MQNNTIDLDRSSQDEKLNLWPFALIILPLVVVVLAGFTTLYIALKHADVPVYENVNKQGKGMHVNTEALSVAAQRKVSVLITQESDSVYKVSLSGESISDEAKVLLKHKVLKAKDQSTSLEGFETRLELTKGEQLTQYHIYLEGGDSEGQAWQYKVESTKDNILYFKE